MKELFESIWNAPKEDVAMAANFILERIAVIFSILFILAIGFISYGRYIMKKRHKKWCEEHGFDKF